MLLLLFTHNCGVCGTPINEAVEPKSKHKSEFHLVAPYYRDYLFKRISFLIVVIILVYSLKLLLFPPPSIPCHYLSNKELRGIRSYWHLIAWTTGCGGDFSSPPQSSFHCAFNDKLVNRHSDWSLLIFRSSTQWHRYSHLASDLTLDLNNGGQQGHQTCAFHLQLFDCQVTDELLPTVKLLIFVGAVTLIFGFLGCMRTAACWLCSPWVCSQCSSCCWPWECWEPHQEAKKPSSWWGDTCSSCFLWANSRRRFRSRFRTWRGKGSVVVSLLDILIGGIQRWCLTPVTAQTPPETARRIL